jgi:hypothetical protein
MNSFGDGGNLDAIHNALRNWEIVWDAYGSADTVGPPHNIVNSDDPLLMPHEMWRRVGFMRHANEFWLLANLVVDRMTSRRMVEDNVNTEQGISYASENHVLPQYDQNNMRQVNELIANFGNARLS